MEKAEQNFADACLYHLRHHDQGSSTVGCQDWPCTKWNLMTQWHEINAGWTSVDKPAILDTHKGVVHT